MSRSCPLCRAPFLSTALVVSRELAEALQQQKLGDAGGGDLECCICMDVLCDPVLLSCGHSGCIGCLSAIREHNQRRARAGSTRAAAPAAPAGATSRAPRGGGWSYPEMAVARQLPRCPTHEGWRHTFPHEKGGCCDGCLLPVVLMLVCINVLPYLM
jgi:hypothetical protein